MREAHPEVPMGEMPRIATQRIEVIAAWALAGAVSGFAFLVMWVRF